MIDKKVLREDIDLAKVLLGYTHVLMETLGKHGIPLQTVMSVEEYISFLAVIHSIVDRIEGKPFDEAIKLADKKITMDITISL